MALKSQSNNYGSHDKRMIEVLQSWSINGLLYNHFLDLIEIRKGFSMLVPLKDNALILWENNWKLKTMLYTMRASWNGMILKLFYYNRIFQLSWLGWVFSAINPHRIHLFFSCLNAPFWWTTYRLELENSSFHDPRRKKYSDDSVGSRTW